MKITTFFHSKKRLVIAWLAAVLVICMATGGTIAYLSSKDEVKNTLTIGKVNITLDEPSWEPENGEDLKPGNVAPKDPTVTAVDGDSYMRIKMEIVDGEGKLITDKNRLALVLETLWFDSGENISADKMYSQAELAALQKDGKITAEHSPAFSFAGIEKDKPAVRYYNYIANDGVFSAENKDITRLFTHVVVPKDWHNTEVFTLSGDTFEETANGSVEILEKGSGYKIILSAEAIQVSEMESADAAFIELDTLTKVTRDTSGITE